MFRPNATTLGLTSFWSYRTFSYDEMGNRKDWASVGSKGWMHYLRRDNGLNQYLSWENNYPANDPSHWGSAIYHDDNSPWAPNTTPPGNGVTMGDGNLVASYNALNQPVAMIPTGSSDITWFGYDPLGRCVKRTVGSSLDNGTAIYLYYDGWDLIQEGPSSSYADRQYIHGARVDEIVKQIKPPTGLERYFHYDARGHCTLQTDSGGAIAEQYAYYAFGYPYFYDGAGNEMGYSQWGNRFLFTGREWLSSLKLYDCRNRMYQPELGRFLQPDPKEFAAGDYNLYRYCHNDPVNRMDPTGLAYISTLTSQGGGDWRSGVLGITNRERDVINADRMEAFFMRPESQKAARDCATASHTAGTEWGRAAGYSKAKDDLTLGRMTENTQDAGAPDGPVRLTTKGRSGVYNGTDFDSKPLPNGYHAVGGIWGLARHQRWWPTGDRRALWEKHQSGLLGIPAEDGHSQPTVLPPYIYIPGSPPPPND